MTGKNNTELLKACIALSEKHIEIDIALDDGIIGLERSI